MYVTRTCSWSDMSNSSYRCPALSVPRLAAYANAEFIARVNDPERYALPPITRFGLVHVTDGGTRLYEAIVTPRDWIAFRACLALHTWSKEKAA